MGNVFGLCASKPSKQVQAPCNAIAVIADNQALDEETASSALVLERIATPALLVGDPEKVDVALPEPQKTVQFAHIPQKKSFRINDSNSRRGSFPAHLQLVSNLQGIGMKPVAHEPYAQTYDRGFDLTDTYNPDLVFFWYPFPDEHPNYNVVVICEVKNMDGCGGRKKRLKKRKLREQCRRGWARKEKLGYANASEDRFLMAGFTSTYNRLKLVIIIGEHHQYFEDDVGQVITFDDNLQSTPTPAKNLV